MLSDCLKRLYDKAVEVCPHSTDEKRTSQTNAVFLGEHRWRVSIRHCSHCYYDLAHSMYLSYVDTAQPYGDFCLVYVLVSCGRPMHRVTKIKPMKSRPTPATNRQQYLHCPRRLIFATHSHVSTQVSNIHSLWLSYGCSVTSLDVTQLTQYWTHHRIKN